MARKRKGGLSPKAAAKNNRVWVCRGCCCGTQRKHPGVPNAALVKIARDGAQEAGFKFRVTDCLGPCARGNIVVVRAAGRIRWFERMNTEEITEALVEHLGAKASLADLPSGLRRRILDKRSDRKPKD